MKMRKLGLGILLFSFVLSLTACSGKDKNKQRVPQQKVGKRPFHMPFGIQAKNLEFVR